MLADNGTIWMSGTHHNIFTLGQVLSQLNFKVLNMITWEKPNPPPNFSCRYFTYSTEWIIWARKNPKIPHYFNYELMKSLNGDKQMKDVWRLPAVSSWEKQFGKHPTQKPLGLLSRIVLASTKAKAGVDAETSPDKEDEVDEEREAERKKLEKKERAQKEDATSMTDEQREAAADARHA